MYWLLNRLLGNGAAALRSNVGLCPMMVNVFVGAPAVPRGIMIVDVYAGVGACRVGIPAMEYIGPPGIGDAERNAAINVDNGSF